MTYKQLLLILQSLDKQQLDSDVAIYDTVTDEYYQLNVDFIFANEECGVLDPDHPIIRF